MQKPQRQKFRQETVIHSYITRPLSIEIIRLLWNTNITANQITIFRIVLNITALVLFFQATFLSICLGYILFQIHEILDSVDGMYARLKKQQSKIGVWLEQFFDAVFSDANGFLGLVISYAAYSITGNEVYFILWGISIIGVKLLGTFLKVFGISKEKNGMEHKEYGDDFLPIFGVGLLKGLKNLYLTVITWQNQFLLLGILLLLPLYKTYGLDFYLYAVAFLSLINQPPWIYVGYLGYQTMKS